MCEGEGEVEKEESCGGSVKKKGRRGRRGRGGRGGRRGRIELELKG